MKKDRFDAILGLTLGITAYSTKPILGEYEGKPYYRSLPKRRDDGGRFGCALSDEEYF